MPLASIGKKKINLSAYTSNLTSNDCCKKLCKFAFSHIGLCLIIIAYCAAGGYIFQHLEQHNEYEECVAAEERYYPVENKTAYNLWGINQNLQDPSEQEEALVEYQKIIQKWRHDVMELKFNGRNCSMLGEEGGPAYMWSFSGAVLFSTTVITSVGYGNIAPKTYWGRIVCMVYATLGIPLMLIWLANIGDVMVDIFRFLYVKICCCGFCCTKKRGKVVQLYPTPANDNTPEAWKAEYMRNARRKNQFQPQQADDEEEEEMEDEQESKINEVSIPLTFVLGAVIFFVVIGAIMFGLWEGWDAMTAAYFCFVTISTIGFGDVVPGMEQFTGEVDPLKMILSAAYMLLGMAILSMCFKIIMQEMVTKVHFVARRLGCMKPEKEKQKGGNVQRPRKNQNTWANQTAQKMDKPLGLTDLNKAYYEKAEKQAPQVNQINQKTAF